MNISKELIIYNEKYKNNFNLFIIFILYIYIYIYIYISIKMLLHVVYFFR